MPKPKNPEHLVTGAELRELMAEHGLTIARLANAVHVSPRQVNYWLAQDSAPRWAAELVRFKLMAGQV